MFLFFFCFTWAGQLLNGQTLLEFSHSSESNPGVFISQLRVKSALLWVRVALNRTITNHYPIIGNKNMTLWVFKVKPSVANTSFLSGKVCQRIIRRLFSLDILINARMTYDMWRRWLLTKKFDRLIIWKNN